MRRLAGLLDLNVNLNRFRHRRRRRLFLRRDPPPRLPADLASLWGPTLEVLPIDARGLDRIWGTFCRLREGEEEK